DHFLELFPNLAFGTSFSWRYWGLLNMRTQYLKLCISLKRRNSCRHEVHHASESIDIGFRRDRLRQHLFRRRVIGRADQNPRPRQVAGWIRCSIFHETKIDQFDEKRVTAPFGQENIRRLEIAMHHASAMCVAERPASLP